MQTVLYHIFVIAGFLLAFLLVIKLLREHRPPGNTLAWLLAIIFVPYVGVPLYFLFGGRKLKKIPATSFSDSSPSLLPSSFEAYEIEKILTSTGSFPVRNGNDVQLIPEADRAFYALMDLIDQAEETIFLTTFILAKDDIGRQVVQALARKAQAGVKVYLLLDCLGSFWASHKFLAPLRNAGGKVGMFMPMFPFRKKWSAHLRNHRKLWIADGKRAIIGGRNIAREYLNPENAPETWRDFNLELRGPAVHDLEQIFVKDWEFATGEKLILAKSTSSSQVTLLSRFIPESPVQVSLAGPDTINDSLAQGVLTAILKAKQKIWIVTPYFIPDELIIRALLLAVKLGREVRVVVPQKSNHLVADFARAAFLRQLIQNGVKVHFYQGGMVHTKLILIDEEISIVGSANLDMRSLYLNFELAAFVYSAQASTELAIHIRSLLAQSEPFTQEAAASHGRLKLWAEDISRLFAPLL